MSAPIGTYVLKPEHAGARSLVCSLPMRHANRVSQQEREQNRLARLAMRTATLWALRVYAMKIALRDMRRPLSDGERLRRRANRTGRVLTRRAAKLAKGGVR